MRVVIMSGISGSGKNTYIKNNFPNSYVVSADDYFESTGEYKFDHTKLSEAHKACLSSFLTHIMSPLEYNKTLVVNNTNTTVMEISTYLAIAKANDASVELITLLKDPEVCAKRNVHGVSLEVCKQMDKRIRDRKFPQYWKFDVVKEVVND